MKKKLFFFSTIILTLVGCTSEDFVGDKELQWQNENGKAISLNLVAAPQTRAPQTGATAAATLNNNFVVYGWKSFTSGTPATQVVFNNYQANYVTGSSNTTTSNSAGSEYVGYTNVPNGVTTKVGVTAFSALTGSGGANASGVEQSIKYWDFSADQYDFFAYSLGTGTGESPSTTYATATQMTSSGYSLSGTGAELMACYISNQKTIAPSGSSEREVELEFRNFASKVKIAFYETIPGYSVKDVKFYPSSSGAAGAIPYLYASSSSLPTGGTYAVTFDGNGKAQLTAPTSSTTAANLAFGTTLTPTAVNEYHEAATTQYIGRSSNAATPSTEVTVLPNPNGTDLYLKVDYTLLSRDGTGETIKVTGATATIPAGYAKWQPNYSYTYLFKISDETNGSTGKSILGLSPITLDAVVNVDPAGSQETITTIAETSITTYQYGSNCAGTNNEYHPIYVIVGNGTTTLTPGTNVNLYTATVTLGSGATANITEASVENAIAHSEGAKDANGNPLAVTLVGTAVSDKLVDISSIPADDAPDGNAITIKGAKFAPVAGTTYVIEYKVSDTEKYYKVIKVASGS